MVTEQDNFSFFRHTIAHWYAANKRDLPWRHTRNPYLIWVSEIILQQTQVAQGLDYYLHFVKRFPDVATLAAAQQEEVLKLWQGLGYYSRARNMHTAAGTIMAHFGGHFPENYADVLSLKGVGEYTAAAICSFAFRQPYATVDGNVFRVLARYFGISAPIDSAEGKKQFAELAQLALDKAQPDVHNQALMEFGALQCVPNAPACDTCPLAASCYALAEHKIAELPHKQGKTQHRDRYFYYYYIVCNGKTFLHQRGVGDVWQGLYEFPLIETASAQTLEQLLAHPAVQQLFGSNTVEIKSVSPTKKHVLSHQRIFAQCICVAIDATNFRIDRHMEVPLEAIGNYPVSRLMEHFIKRGWG